MSSWESDLLLGFAGLFDGQGVGKYRGDGTAYAAGETAIVFGELPTAPHRVIGLTLYGSNDEAKQNLSRPRLQVMCRGGVSLPLDAGDIASAVFMVLQGIEHRDYGAAHLVQALRVSSVPLGVDDSKRTMRADNYQLEVNTPHSAGRPA